MKTPSLLSRLTAIALFTILIVAVFVLHLDNTANPPAHAPERIEAHADRKAVYASLSPEAVGRTFAEISAFGSRAPGQPGLDRTRRYLLDRFRALGLDVYEQDVDLPYPLLAPGSGAISNAAFRLDAWPFAPNYAQPVTTGPDGLDGELLLADSATMRSCMDFTGKIAVIDAGGDIFEDFGFNPARYADLGVAAVVITHRDGLEHVPWTGDAKKAILKNLPVNIVRLACPPEILRHVGERVHVDAVSTWRNVRTRNVVGVLRAAKPTGKALVIPVQYDATSMLPDLAPGSLEAFQTAILVQTAEALATARDFLRRDVVFAATTGMSQSHAGQNRLLSAIGVNEKREYAAKILSAAESNNETRAGMIEEIAALFDDPAFALPGHENETAAAIRALPPATQKFLSKRFSAAMRKSVFEQAERLLEARIAFQRRPDDLSSPEYHAFRAAKTRYDDLNNLSGLPIAQAIGRPLARECVFSAADGAQTTLRNAFRSSIEHLRAFHRDRRASLAADRALLDLFTGYDDFIALSVRLTPSDTPGSEKIGVSPGRAISRGESLELFQTIANEAVYKLGLRDDVTVVKGTWSGFHDLFSDDLDTLAFGAASYPACSLVSAKEAAKRADYPFPQMEFADLAHTVGNSLSIFAEVAVSLAEGRGTFPRLPVWGSVATRGAVFAAGIGNSVVPNYPVEGAFVCSLDEKQDVITDPYGEYDMPFVLMPALGGERWRWYDAFLFDRFGRPTHAKDFGKAAQLIYASHGMNWNYLPVNHVLYRAAPVALLNSVNPQSLKAFTGFSFINPRGLGEFSSSCRFVSEDGLMDFLPPDVRYFLTLKAGAAHNELVSVTRAFCLGAAHTNDPAFHPSGNEIDGPGYLAADTPVFHDVATEAISSMAWLADKRLDLQRRYDMADEMTEAFAAKAAALAARDNAECTMHNAECEPSTTHSSPVTRSSSLAAANGEPALARLKREKESLSYLILNHPVIRESIGEAVLGILWYLGLLVPFAFFFEKLVFGFTDIRRQILAQGAVFLAVFCLLRLLHPAFHMIRSSAMILLGFIIILVVGSVTAVLSGKFKESFDALRRAQGHVAGAEGNRAGIVLTAFMLGLNNMHRRKVRTGLTCATLVLMTFVMICFTSVQSNVVETERAVGRANYQGIVIRKKQYGPMATAEISALKSAFGERHRISRRNFYAGYYDGTAQCLRSPEFKVEAGEGEKTRLRAARAALGFDCTEPLGRTIRLLCTNGWFTAGQQHLVEAPYPVILSDLMATQLGITEEMVEAAPVPVTINGARYFVHNIFAAASLDAATDPDGRDLLPFDTEALANTRIAPDGFVLADESDARVDAADVILGINEQLTTDKRGIRTVSAVVDMGNVPYPVARREILSYMEQSGQECHYALDGTAFVGRRARMRSAAGVLDLLIPLVIAALTVLNTMKGSVYERQNEIYVYNAVGIAPKYIFFMFVAEALVYSVVGAVLGYLLSQGVGRLLTLLGLTGGVNMNFTTVTCVHASLAIAAATLLSTWFPARTAMEIAKPADNAGWTLPEPDADDRLAFYLPFTFTHVDRIAVLAFFHKYFDGFGEGSAGSFFASDPKLKIADRLDDLADGAYIPALEVRVWLKPFDLGVSQRLEIELGTDPDTKEYIAKMILTRLSGTRDAWMRLNKPFVTAVRRQFLHWRAVDDDQKVDLFAEAKALLTAAP